MSLFKKKGPKPDLNSVSANIDSRTETMNKKIDKLDKELANKLEIIKATKKGTSPHNNARSEALRLMKQKNVLQRRKEQIMSTGFNVDAANFNLATVHDTKDINDAMKSAMKEFKKEYKKIKIDKLADLTDDLQEQMDLANEIGDELSVNISGENDYDLEAELDALTGSFDEEDIESSVNSPPSQQSDETRARAKEGLSSARI